MTRPKPVFIYCLKDPTTGDVRYIGKTDSLKSRLRAHLGASSKKKSPLGIWLRGLSEAPILAVLHEVAEHESWVEEERRYISCARAMGIDLVNATDGGEGVTMTPQILAAIKAARSTAEAKVATSVASKLAYTNPITIAKTSAATKENWADPDIRARACAAIKSARSTPESRAKTSAVSRALRATPEARAQTSAVQKKSWADPKVRKARITASHTPEIGLAHSIKMKLKWSDPEFRAKVAATKAITREKRSAQKPA